MAINLELRSLTRSQLRYRLYRIQNNDILSAEDGIKEFFESQELFDGWHNFTKTWDVGREGKWPDGHWVAVKRKKSMEQEWNETLARVVQDFPTGGDN